MDSFQTTQKMREEMHYVLGYLQGAHYERAPISKLDMVEFITSYMATLDYNRHFFYDSDRVDFDIRFAGIMETYLSQKTLMPAFEIFKVYKQRATSRVDWIQHRLKGDFDFSKDETYFTERKEADWPTGALEADKYWERRLKFELLNEAMGRVIDEDIEGITDENAESKKDAPVEKSFEESLVDAKETVRKRYENYLRNLKQIEPAEVQEYFLTTLMNMYDPHSSFMSADTHEDFAIGMKNSLVGIGAMLSTEDGICTIKELIPGGPADKSNKLSPEDKIVGVGQADGEVVDVVGMKLRKIVKLIRGEKGTRVRLQIQPAEGDPASRKIVELIRDKIELTDSRASASIHMLPHGEETIPIGVIELHSFYGAGRPGMDVSATDDVEQLLKKLNARGVKGVVLDLRRNGGGLLNEAVGLAGLFIPVGPVLQVRNAEGYIDEHLDRNPKVAWDGPLAVLVSRFSASASEIVTGALKNHRRALVAGDSATHGKGTVQAVFEMDRSSFLRPTKPQKGAAKITIQKWYLPNGNSTQSKGVPSDIVFPSENEFLPIGEGDLPHALEWDKISPLRSYDEFSLFGKPDFEDGLISGALIENLKGTSMERRSSLEEFNYLTERVNWFEQRQKEQKHLSINLETRQKRKDDFNAFKEKMDEWLEELSELNFDKEEVLLDVTLEKKEESRLAHEQAGIHDEDAEEDKPRLDIHLRETMRILGDWIYLDENGKLQPLIVKDGL